MSNTNTYSSIFQKELDKQVLESSTSGWMEENAGQVIYNGGKEIKMPKMSLQGLGNYDRDKGYTSGAVTYSYETMTMTQDRGRRFRLDAMDVTETDFAMVAANVASEFQRTQVIPEIDAYRYSALSSKAGIKKEYTAAASTVLSKLLADLGEVMNITGGEGQTVITIARPVYDMLMTSTEISKFMEVKTVNQGDVSFEVKSLNGAVIIPVSSARMMSEYSFKTGESDEVGGGFAATSTAKKINWIICPKTAPVAVSKTDNVKIIAPENNQFADAWDIDYRKYHDLFVGENAAESVLASFAPTATQG